MMSPYREPTPADGRRAALYLGALVAVVVGTGFWLLPRHGNEWLLLWSVIGLGIPVFLLVRWHARTTAYRCATCRHEFVISAWTDFITPHIPGKKYVACPSCGVRGWAKVLMREGGTAPPARKEP
jgi:DNA-directed RNA polymerase subunit RPC12/RpoP